jgi:hypothetical protein
MPPSHGELRFSSRTANKVTNYNLDDDEEDEEDLAVTPNEYAAWEDETPGIDVVLDHELKEGKGEVPLCHVCSLLLTERQICRIQISPSTISDTR